MDFKSITGEQIKAMSEEEKREYVRELIHAGQEDTGIKATFYNPSTDEALSLVEFANRMGEEKAIDIAVKALSSEWSAASTVTKEQLLELREKQVNGTATEEELRLLHMIDLSYEDSDEIQYQKNATGVILSLIKFAQDCPKFYPTIGDLALTSNLLILASMSLTPDTQTHNYIGELDTLTKIAQDIGDDILDAWSKTLSVPMAPELIVAGLCQALAKVAIEADIVVPPAEHVFTYVGLDASEFCDEEDGPVHCHCCEEETGMTS